jgi:Rv2258c-like winged HTH domain
VIDPRLNAFQGTAISALGDALGYYRALAAAGLTPAELAEQTITNERFARQWLARQAARGHIGYEPQSGRYFLNEDQRASLTDSNADLIDAWRVRATGVGGDSSRKSNDSKVQGESGHGRPSPAAPASPHVLAARFNAPNGCEGKASRSIGGALKRIELSPHPHGYFVP